MGGGIDTHEVTLCDLHLITPEAVFLTVHYRGSLLCCSCIQLFTLPLLTACLIYNDIYKTCNTLIDFSHSNLLLALL